VIDVTQQVVTGPAEALQIPGLQQVVQPEQHGQIHATWGVLPVRQALRPARQPVRAQSLSARPVQPLQQRRQQQLRFGQQGNGSKVKGKIIGMARTNADRVGQIRILQTEEIVQHDRVQWRTQLQQTRRRGVQVPPPCRWD